MVEVSDLSKTFYTGFFAPIPWVRNRQYGTLHRVIEAVRGVSFSIQPQQIYALLGSNGAGKSTTMKMLMGLIRPTQGRATLFGVDCRRADARRRVGYLPENPSFYEELTPIELMRLFCAMNGLNHRQASKESADLLERVGMSYAADRPLRKLSKGMHQRVGIAQALIGSPDLIVLDEPFSGLDPIGRREVREVLLAERDRGATLLLSSHILPDVEALCDHFLVLDRGRVRHRGELRELSASTGEVEVTIAQCHASLLEALNQLQHDPQAVSISRDTWRLTISHEHTRGALRLIDQHEGELLSLQRKRPPLEELFLSKESDEELKR